MEREPNGVVVRRPGDRPATWAMGSLFEHLVDSRREPTAGSVSHW